MSYAVSKKMSKEPEKFGTGHVEGIIESGSANNSALAGAWIPALVFGIPGDSITAIVIGVPKTDRKSTRLNSSHVSISYAVFCLKKKNKNYIDTTDQLYPLYLLPTDPCSYCICSCAHT